MIEVLKAKLNEYLGEHQHLSRQVKEEEKALGIAKKKLCHAGKAQKVLQVVAEAVQRQAHQEIAEIVNRCLDTVFEGEDYEFRIRFEQKRNRTEAQLSLSRAGCDGGDGMECEGGGVVDVAAFGLRLASLLLSRPQKRKLLVLDEPFRFVSKEYRPAVAALLDALSREMNVQIIMVTHSEELMTGKVVRL